MCAAVMAAAGSKERSRLQLQPCFRSLLLPSSSLLTQHPRRYACSWSVSVFSLGRGRRQEHAACVGKNALFSLLAAFIPLLNDKRCLEGWIRLFSSLF